MYPRLQTLDQGIHCSLFHRGREIPIRIRLARNTYSPDGRAPMKTKRKPTSWIIKPKYKGDQSDVFFDAIQAKIAPHVEKVIEQHKRMQVSIFPCVHDDGCFVQQLENELRSGYYSGRTLAHFHCYTAWVIADFLDMLANKAGIREFHTYAGKNIPYQRFMLVKPEKTEAVLFETEA